MRILDWLKKASDLLFFPVYRNIRKQLDRFTFINKRPVDDFLINHFKGRPVVGVEIGVLIGEHSIVLSKILNIKKLYLIDPFGIDEENKASIKWDLEDVHRIFCMALKKCGKNAVFLRKYSDGAFGDITENIDFIYLDALYDYGFIMRTLELYYAKLNVGGVFCLNCSDMRFIGLIKAVIDFTAKYDLEILGFISEGTTNCCFIKK